MKTRDFCTNQDFPANYVGMKHILYFAGYFGTIPIMLYLQYAFSRLNINVTRLNVIYEANYNDGAPRCYNNILLEHIQRKTTTCRGKRFK